MRTEVVVQIRCWLVSLLAAAAMLPPPLTAQRPDSAVIAAGQLVERARRIAERGDTVAYRHALALLDTAERIARVAPIFRTRALIGLAYAERLVARAHVTGACADARRAAQVAELVDTAMPMDDLSNDPRLPRAIERLAALRDSVAAARRRACG